MTGSKLAVSRVGWIAALAAVLSLVVWTAGIARGAISECVDATCRITSPDGSRGTGCVFEIQGGVVYVLTVAHVVGDASSVVCEFWREGHQSQPLEGRVAARATAADVAVVAVPEAVFAGRLPAAVPLAPRHCAVRPGQTLASVGCANGAWSTAWKGHVLDCRGDELQFVPPPANGRSGSALFDADGQHILGLVRARTADSSTGIATPIETIYQALDAPASSTAKLPDGVRAGTAGSAGPSQPVQCGPNGCPLGGPAPSPAPGYHLLPYRQNLDHQIDGLKNPGGPWPTLPVPPAAVPQPVPAAPLGPDPATAQALGELGRATERNAGEIRQLRDEALPKAIDQAIRPIGEKISAIDAAVQPLERIKTRLDEDIAAGGLKGRLAQHIEDLAEGKAESHDPKLRLILITMAIAGGVGLLIFLVVRQHQAAGSLAGVVTQAKAAVDAVAAKAPVLAPAATGLDAIGNLLLKQLAALQGQPAAAAPAAPAAATAAAAASPTTSTSPPPAAH
jgi:S1-C subfamily serine protease